MPKTKMPALPSQTPEASRRGVDTRLTVLLAMLVVREWAVFFGSPVATVTGEPSLLVKVSLPACEGS